MAIRKSFNPGSIGVLMGGVSKEREISLKSGRAVVEALSRLGLDVKPIDINTENRDDNIELLTKSGIACAFVALHGYFGEDGQIQEILQSAGIPYTGSGPDASRDCMDKSETIARLKSAGFILPKGRIFERENGFSLDGIKDLCPPFVVKPCSNGSSIGVYFVDDAEGARLAANKAFEIDTRIIVEEFIGGKELTVGILAGQALPVIGIVPRSRFFDFNAKYSAGITEYEVPAVIPPDVAAQAQETALKAHNALGCRGYSRVDMIFSQDRIYVLEINTIPGMTATSLLPKAARLAGMDFSDLCLRLVELAYEKN